MHIMYISHDNLYCIHAYLHAAYMCSVTYCRIAVCGLGLLASTVVTTELRSVVSKKVKSIYGIQEVCLQYIWHTGSMFTVYMTYRKYVYSIYDIQEVCLQYL